MGRHRTPPTTRRTLLDRILHRRRAARLADDFTRADGLAIAEWSTPDEWARQHYGPGVQ